MQKVIDTFIDEAAKAGDWHQILGFQWILNAEHNDYTNILQEFLIEHEKGA